MRHDALAFDDLAQLRYVLTQRLHEGTEALERLLREEFTQGRTLVVGRDQMQIRSVQLRELADEEPGEDVIAGDAQATPDNSRLALTVNIDAGDRALQLLVREPPEEDGPQQAEPARA